MGTKYPLRILLQVITFHCMIVYYGFQSMVMAHNLNFVLINRLLYIYIERDSEVPTS